MGKKRVINKEKFLILFEKRCKDYKNGIRVLYKKDKGYKIYYVHKPIQINTDNIYINTDNSRLNININNIEEYQASLDALYLVIKNGNEIIINI